MNRQLAIALTAAMMLAAHDASAAYFSYSLSFERRYDRAGLRVEPVRVEGTDYKRVTLRSASSTTIEVGRPELPIDDVLVLLPPDAHDVAVAVASSDSEQVWSNDRVMPVPPPVILPSGRPAPVSPPQSSGSARLTAQVLGTPTRYGARVAIVRLAPLELYGNELRLNTRIALTLSYRATPGSSESYRRIPAAQQAALRREVVNPGALDPIATLVLSTSSSPDSTFAVHTTEPARQEVIPYVIITPQALAPSFQPLVEWRTSTGDAGKIVTTEWIAANYPGVDDANRIRNFISDAVARWSTSWVLLGGDTDQVAFRAGYYDDITSSFGPTDLYYSGQSPGVWNDDGDAIFGEFFSDGMDIDPDLFVGRAPVSTAAEAATFIQKLFTYEQAPPQYIERALLMGVSSLGSDGLKENPIRSILPSSYQTDALYNAGSPYLSMALAPLDSASAIAAVNQGYHVINHMDHSGINSMGTGADHGGGAIMDTDAAAFTNGTKASIVWTYGCDPNAFDYESISEAWMTNAGGGAVAFVGNTRTGYASQYIQDKPFFDGWFTHRDGRIGSIFNRTQGGGFDEYKSSAMNLLGDPAMPLWIQQPTSLSVTGTTAFQTGANAVALTVGNLPAGLEATVTFEKTDENLFVVRQTSGGVLNETLTLDKAGTLTVAVRSSEHLPWKTTHPVTAANTGHLYLASVQIDDVAATNDQKLEPGEQATLKLQIANGGAAATAPASATISAATAGVTVTNPSAAIPALAASATTTLSFPIALAGTFADGDAITLDLALGSATTSVTIPVFAARLEQTHSFVEIGGNGNGIPEAGETVEVRLHVINNGFGDADAVTATVAATTSNVTVINATVSAGDIAAKSAVDPANVLKLALSSSFSSAADPVLLTFADSLGNTTVQTIELRVPDAPANLRTRGNATSVRLLWDAPTDPLSRNYRVYRGPLGGPYASLETFLFRDASTYTDTTANGTQTFTYQVATVDQFGNESARKSIDALPSLDAYPGFPRAILPADGAIRSAIAAFDVDGDGAREIFAFSSQGDRDPGALYAWNSQGNEFIAMPGGDPNFAEFALLDGGSTGVPAFADIDGDGQTDIIANGLYRVYAFQRDGTPVAGWAGGVALPAFTGSTCPPNSRATVGATSPVVADLDGDHQPEIITTAYDWTEYCDGAQARIYVFKADGTLLAEHHFPRADYSFGAPAVADLDRDGAPEVVFANHYDPGNQLPHDGEIWVLDSPSVLTKRVSITGPQFVNEVSLGDLDADGNLDAIVASTADHRIYAFRLDSGCTIPTGCAVNGWAGGVALDPGDQIPDLFAPSVAVAVEDLDCDQRREVVAVGEQSVYVFEHDGTRKIGWPVPRDGAQGTVTSVASPLIADVDGDADLDIIVASKNTSDEGVVEAWDAQSGALVPHFPVIVDEPLLRTPAIADLDYDGRAELIAAGGRRLYVWNTAGFAGRGLDVWSQLLRDPAHTSTAPIKTIPPSYLTGNSIFCQTASFICTIDSRPFQDTCGCGCIRPAWPYDHKPIHRDDPLQ